MVAADGDEREDHMRGTVRSVSVPAPGELPGGRRASDTGSAECRVFEKRNAPAVEVIAMERSHPTQRFRSHHVGADCQSAV
jgi:hypothetical protein